VRKARGDDGPTDRAVGAHQRGHSGERDEHWRAIEEDRLARAEQESDEADYRIAERRRMVHALA
jgi:hypothetical protein